MLLSFADMARGGEKERERGGEREREREAIKTGGTPPSESNNLCCALLIKEIHNEHILTNHSQYAVLGLHASAVGGGGRGGRRA